MFNRVLLALVRVTVIFTLVTFPAVGSVAGQPGDSAAKVDPRVLADTRAGQSAHFLVVLQTQADARQAAAQNAVQPGLAVYAVLSQAVRATQPAVVSALRLLGAPAKTFTIVNLIATYGNRSIVMAMAARLDVAYITPDDAFTVPLEQPGKVAAPQSVAWNLTLVHADSLWAKGITGQGIVYANADTGVDWQHPALKSHYRGWDGASETDSYNWWDAIHSAISGSPNPCGYSSPHPCDDEGHGTHTMGTGIGQAPGSDPIGVAPGASWIACRNMDQGAGRPSTYIECLDFFLAPWDQNHQNPDPSKRPDVVSNSYTCEPGSEMCGLHDLQAAITNLRAAGVFFSASAGNSGPTCSSISQDPALEPVAFTVGATGYQTISIASFSSRGPVTVDGSGLLKPNLVAPGTQIVSSLPGGGYGSMSGTSMAAPHVAGAVALLWSAFPGLRHQVAETELLLERTAQPEKPANPTRLCGEDTVDSIPNNDYGYGFLNILAAYTDQSTPFHWIFPFIRAAAP